MGSQKTIHVESVAVVGSSALALYKKRNESMGSETLGTVSDLMAGFLLQLIGFEIIAAPPVNPTCTFLLEVVTYAFTTSK